MKSRVERGMTLLEIMIVVLIISILAMMAFPAIQKIRESSQNARLIADMRIAVHAFDQKSFEQGGLPADAAPGVVPVGMDGYLTRMKWSEPTPIDGQWDWDPAIAGFGPGVVVVLSSAQDTRMADVDIRVDDGDLTQGLFQKVGAASYAYLIE